MPREIQKIGDCPKCRRTDLACTYNQFKEEDLIIDSWQHKCPDCGFRETTAYRSDDEDLHEASIDPRVCPYCGRMPQATR